MGFFRRLYSFEPDIDFKKGWKVAAILSIAFCAISLAFLGTRGLNLGIDFRGGVSWQFPAQGKSVSDITNAVHDAGQSDTQVQTLGRNDIRVEVPPVSNAEEDKVASALAKATGQSLTTINANLNEVGPSWGHDVSNKAIRALVFFMIAVFIYIWIRLEWRFALGAIIAVVHDVVVSVGVYAIFQFQVTPGTVIAFLTILGYSLYDTIVVYDKIKENQARVTPNGGLTYTDMANLSVNQTFMRSINTTLSAVLPVLAILIVGAWIMGAVTLEEFGLALLVGLISGAYSSVFIAAPITAWVKERQPRNQQIRRRVEALRAEGRLPAMASVGAGAAAVADDAEGPVGSEAAPESAGERAQERERETAGAAAGAAGGAGAVRPRRPSSTNTRYSTAHPPRPRKKTPDKRRKR